MTAKRMLHVVVGGSLLFASPSWSSVTSWASAAAPPHPPAEPPQAPASSAASFSEPSAIRLTFPGHTHIAVKPGYTLVVSYRSPACPLQVRRSASVTMETIKGGDDARGLTVNGGEMLGNVGASACYLGIVLYPATGLNSSGPLTAPSSNAP